VIGRLKYPLQVLMGSAKVTNLFGGKYLTSPVYCIVGLRDPGWDRDFTRAIEVKIIDV